MRSVRGAIVAAVAVAAVGGCSGGEEPQSRPSPTPSDPFIRASDLPAGVIVENQAISPHIRRRMNEGIADLKGAGYWDDLTDHLYVVRFAAREGLEEVPRDGHLAQAELTRRFSEDGAGEMCLITFFPDAVARDLLRVAGGPQGLTPEFVRAVWSSIMGHELAHCLDGGSGESAAREWEQKVFEAVMAQL